jgi:hypothetical protein
MLRQTFRVLTRMRVFRDPQRRMRSYFGMDRTHGSLLRTRAVRSRRLALVSLVGLTGWGWGWMAGNPFAARAVSCAARAQSAPCQITLFSENEPHRLAHSRETATGRVLTTLETVPEKPAIPAPAGAPEAPSVLWLIVMPAIPILGGGFIYFKRAWMADEDESCPSSSPAAGPSAPPASDNLSPHSAGTGDSETGLEKD